MGSPRRAVLDFDVAGSVPAGSIIESAQLTLALQGVGGLKSMNGSLPAMHGGIAVRAGRVTDRQEFTTMP
jgi:hypothetical protein